MFFDTTESKAFRNIFYGWIKPAARFLGFGSRDMNAAYRLLTRAFYYETVWFANWLARAKWISSARSKSGATEYRRAGRACRNIVDTAGLGGTVISKFKIMPRVAAAGYGIKGVATVCRNVCIVFNMLETWKAAYDAAIFVLNSFNIRVDL